MEFKLTSMVCGGGTMHDSIKSSVWIGSIVDSTSSTVWIGEAVLTTDVITVTHFVLAFGVARVVIIDRVSELIMGMGVVRFDVGVHHRSMNRGYVNRSNVNRGDMDRGMSYMDGMVLCRRIANVLTCM